MADSGLADDAIKIASGFGGLGGGLVFARWFIGWLTGRHDKREADLREEDSEINERWRVYREAVESRCTMLETKVARLEREVDDCHADKRQLEARLVRLEAFADARGQMRNAAQANESARHLIAGDET